MCRVSVPPPLFVVQAIRGNSSWLPTEHCVMLLLLLPLCVLLCYVLTDAARGALVTSHWPSGWQGGLAGLFTRGVVLANIEDSLG